MSLKTFIRENREEIDRIIRSRCDNLGRLNDDARRGWILNYEPLYAWARAEGVPV